MPNLTVIIASLVIAIPVCNGTGWAEIHPQILDDDVYFGAAPEDDTDFQILRELGVQHVIDLRSFQARAGAREHQLARRYGMVYERCAISFTPKYPQSSVESSLQKMRCRPCGPVYVHCSLGRDRTGLIAALYRHRYLGWQAELAHLEKKQNEFNGLLLHYNRYFWDSVRCHCSH